MISIPSRDGKKEKEKSLRGVGVAGEGDWAFISSRFFRKMSESFGSSGVNLVKPPSNKLSVSNTIAITLFKKYEL